MVMLRPAGEAYKIAKKVLKKEGIKVRKPNKREKLNKRNVPFLQH